MVKNRAGRPTQKLRALCDQTSSRTPGSPPKSTDTNAIRQLTPVSIVIGTTALPGSLL